MRCLTNFLGYYFAICALVVAAGCGSEETPGGGTGGVVGTGGAGGGGGSGNVGGCPPCVERGAELADNGCDDNCNGTVDESITCDTTLELDSTASVDGARAIDICKAAASDEDWGVTLVEYSLPAGEAPPGGQQAAFDLGHGMLTSFGTVTPREGFNLLALSSGSARDVDDPGYQDPAGFDKGYQSGQPDGFPPNVPACSGATLNTPHDGIALTVELRVPPNASAFAFDFAYYTADFPTLVCSDFSDVFAVFLGTAGNLSVDDAGNPISVNSDLLDACGCDGGPPCDAGGLTFECSLGESVLSTTGYEGAGATGWLTTTAPVESDSEIAITFAIWDSGDGAFDATVLIDNFRWVEHEGGVVTEVAAE